MKHMGINTKEGMDTHVYTYTRYNYEEPILGTGNA
jgi:hypothetical protein